MNNLLQIYIGADHAGFALKATLVDYLSSLKIKVVDVGTDTLDPLDDYPDFVAPVARAVSEDPKTRKGIFIGGSGQGEAMLANRFPNVRATVFYGGDMEIVHLSRFHNDANILSFGARFVTEEEAVQAIKIWLETDLSDDPKYQRRIDKAENLTT